MHIQATGRTDTGKKRKNNEDSLLVDDGMGFYVVADGIGGQSAGEVASSMAVEVLHDAVRAFLEKNPPQGPEEVSSALVSGFKLANGRIISSANSNPGLEGMGTTMTSLLVRGSIAHIAHVGDSRAYLLREGTLTQVTDDHGLVAEQVRAGLVTPEQAKRSPYRHIITRALGIGQELQVDLRTMEVRAYDVFLLCTDGLTEMVEDYVIERILQKMPTDRAAGELVNTANRNGGVDNITVVVVRFGDR